MRGWVSLVGKVITWKDRATSPVWPHWTMTSLCHIAEVGDAVWMRGWVSLCHIAEVGDERVGITCVEGDHLGGHSQLTHLFGFYGP